MDSSPFAEDPAGPSPWASSPKQSRSSFQDSRDGPAHSAMPGSPTPPGRASLESSQDLAASSALAASTDSSANGATAATSVDSSVEYRPQTPTAQTEQQQQPQQQQRTPAQRYHRPQGSQSQQQQQQQQQQPLPTPQRQQQQFKLQPKVTGLERPTRKDLIIRFDIYVRSTPSSAPPPPPPPPRDPTAPPTSFDDLVPSSAVDPSLTLPQTNLPTFRTTQFRDVRRTHTEFQKLAEHLISANPEALVPAVPPSSTPAGIGTDEDDLRVKAAMQHWLGIVCANDILMRDDELVRFIEGDPGYSPVYKRSQPATGVRRKMLKQFAPPPDDTPELADARPTVKKFYLSTMDASQKLDRAVKARRSLGLALNTFGSTLASVGDLEPYPALKAGQRKLGRTVQTTGDLYAAQATMEATALADPLAYLSSDAFIVKETLTNRQILQRELLQAQAATRAKLSATDRLRSSTSVRRDKVDEAIASLEEARESETYLATKTARVTACLLHEHRRWSARTTADLRSAIREFTIRQIEAERRQLASLEAVRPDVRAIDPAGGLSRLGRDGPRSRMQGSSQGPKGDAWSGVQRRPDGGLSRGLSGMYPSGAAKGDDDDASSVQTTEAARTRGNSIKEDEDEDKVDARNAASRLAASFF